MPVATDPTAKAAASSTGLGRLRNMKGVLSPVSRGAATIRLRREVGAPKRGSARRITASATTEDPRGMRV